MTKEEFKTLLKNSLTEVVTELKLQNDEDQIMDTHQAAVFLNITVPTIYDKTSRKLIPHYKQGKKILFKKSDLLAWIESGKISTKNVIETEANRYLLKFKFRS